MPSKTAEKHKAACAKYKADFFEKHGYLFCEVCGRSNSMFYAAHHIYFASRYPKHKELHNFKNLILVCDFCHALFHGGGLKDVFERLEEERGLTQLFK